MWSGNKEGKQEEGVGEVTVEDELVPKDTLQQGVAKE